MKCKKARTNTKKKKITGSNSKMCGKHLFHLNDEPTATALVIHGLEMELDNNFAENYYFIHKDA